jgi:glycosyltransferase involved in cell wall biosynthesis
VTKLVTICVPIHNGAETLSQTLESIFGQDYPLHKVKLFDNASSDRTPEIIRSFVARYPQIEVHRNDVLVSAEDNFTNCIQAAEGDFSAILHSDDVYEKNFISSSVSAFEARPDCLAVFSHAKEIDLENRELGERFLPPFLKRECITYLNFKEFFASVLNFANYVTCPSAVVRSEVYRDVVQRWNGGDYKTSADLDTWLRISKVGTIGFISGPLMKYRVATTSLSYRMAKVRVTKHDLFRVLSKYVGMNSEWLSKDNMEDYTFLHMKDDAFRIINSYKNKLPIRRSDYGRVDWSIVFRRIFRTRWHFKIAVGIVVGRMLLLGNSRD